MEGQAVTSLRHSSLLTTHKAVRQCGFPENPSGSLVPVTVFPSREVRLVFPGVSGLLVDEHRSGG